METGSRPVRVLVADDAPTVTGLIRRGLEALDWEVVVFGDGAEACQAGMSDRWDLALIDHLMPGMLGAEILAMWRNEAVSIPTIVLSGVDDDEITLLCLELGAVDFIRKPFNLAELRMRARLHVRPRAAA